MIKSIAGTLLVAGVVLHLGLSALEDSPATQDVLAEAQLGVAPGLLSHVTGLIDEALGQ